MCVSVCAHVKAREVFVVVVVVIVLVVLRYQVHATAALLFFFLAAAVAASDGLLAAVSSILLLILLSIPPSILPITKIYMCIYLVNNVHPENGLSLYLTRGAIPRGCRVAENTGFFRIICV